MTPMLELLLMLLAILAGSAAGGALRFLVSGLVARAVGEAFPWGTMVVNVTGSFMLGAFAGLAGQAEIGGAALAWRLADLAFVGSYTTVSSFSLQTLALARDGEHVRAALNVALSLGLCLTGAVAGFAAEPLLASLGWW